MTHFAAEWRPFRPHSTELLKTLAGCLAVVMASAAGAFGEAPSRAGLLAARRQEKARHLSPPRRERVDKGIRAVEGFIDRFSRLQESSAGFFYSGGDFPSGKGFAFGIGYQNRGLLQRGYVPETYPNRIDLRVEAAYSTRSYQQLSARLDFRNLGGSIFNLGLRGKYFEWPQEDFFGIGIDAQEKDRANYLLRQLEAGADLWLEPIRRLRVGGGTYYLSPSVGSGRDTRYPTLEALFDPATVPGFERQPDFLRIDAFIDYDLRDNPDYPRRGTFLGSKFSNYRDRHFDLYHFRRWEFDLQRYFSLGNEYRTLVFHANMVMTDVGANDRLPFYYMPDLGGGERLRGFRERRFRDKNAMLVQIEYRWYASWFLDMALFADSGKVASRRAEIDFSDWQYSGGMGFRIHTRDSFVYRLDVALSRERLIPLFRASVVF
jgi:outer membrane protein assembly factor BamA